MAVDLPRETALKIIYDVNEKGAYSNISLNRHLLGSELKDKDRAFITDLVYGTVKWRLSIDWIIEQFSRVRLKKLSPWILNILRLGIYQLQYTDRIPESAACNESVKLAKKYGHDASSAYVNGVMRNVARSKRNIAYPDIEKDLEKYLSVRFSHPQWLVKIWLERYGRDFTEGLLSENNGIPNFSIRVNTFRTSKDKLIEELEGEGLEVADGQHLSEALIVKNPSSVTRMQAFKAGLFQVQDESSMLVSRVLDPRPGELAMDVCSAPGGKATHMAQLMKNEGAVIARDIHEHKIKLIRETAERLGLSIVKPEKFDALEVDASLAGKADRVLVDAPCTGMGIIRRKPDIKWTRKPEDSVEITKLQRDILKASSAYVKPGGFLVYSTCTIEPEENEGTVEAFLLENPEFTAVDFKELLPAGLKQRITQKGFIQTYPHLDGIDGFFIAKLQRKG